MALFSSFLFCRWQGTTPVDTYPKSQQLWFPNPYVESRSNGLKYSIRIFFLWKKQQKCFRANLHKNWEAPTADERTCAKPMKRSDSSWQLNVYANCAKHFKYVVLSAMTSPPTKPWLESLWNGAPVHFVGQLVFRIFVYKMLLISNAFQLVTLGGIGIIYLR